jgi:pimeloyl-ACP methyl ester carboxylesterase
VQVGSLGCIDSAACAPAGAASYEVPAQVLLDGKSYMAFALLRAPADFTRRGSGDDESQPRRPLHITATFASADGVKAKQTAELSLARPPVVLLHGIWSELATWKWPLQQDSNFLVLAWSYKDTNSARFAVNLEQPRLAIRAALDALRFKGVAVTQADFVGHSMGGILARLYAGEFNGLKYYRDDNLHAGDIHKLITLDTPHAGSELADQLVDDNGAATLKGEAAAAGLQECMICGAVSDLRTLSSILRNMPAAPPPAHAIVGVGGGAVLDDLGGFAAAAKDVGGPTARLALAAGAGADWIVGTVFGGRNDLIVSETSQRGGLPDDAVTVFEYQLPFGMALHTTVTSEGRISDEVVKLLNQPVGSPPFSHFEKTGR